jgi:hypothetical protein
MHFLIQNGLKQRDALPQVLFNFSLEYGIRKVAQMGEMRKCIKYSGWEN